MTTHTDAVPDPTPRPHAAETGHVVDYAEPDGEAPYCVDDCPGCERERDEAETAQAHAAGDHHYCDATCEAAFPSEALRNTILFRAIPGSPAMLVELERRAAAQQPAPDATPTSTERVLAEVLAERGRQDEKWGEQNHPDGTGHDVLVADYLAASLFAHETRTLCQQHAAQGSVSWLDVLSEEIGEAFTETDPAGLRAELVQVAAVAVAWAEAIDRRKAAGQ